MSTARRLVGATFVATGTLHFLRPRIYEAIMPDYLPARRALVLASGVAEIAGGAGLLSERTRSAAGWWLVATLVAVFPANLQMALHADRYPQFPPALLWARLPLQAVFVWCVGRVSGPRRA